MQKISHKKYQYKDLILIYSGKRPKKRKKKKTDPALGCLGTEKGQIKIIYLVFLFSSAKQDIV